LTPAGRFVLVSRIAAGRPVAHVAAEMGISRTTAWRWWRRFQAEGRPGLVDRPSVARTHPARTSPCTETRVRIARMLSRRGPVWIGHHLGVPASTVGRILARHHIPALRDCDPLTGQLIRASRRSANRYEHPYPGSLVHVDVKKLGRIPDGGGWRGDPSQSAANHVTGHGAVGYDFVHTAIDDHSRLAYAEIHADETGSTCAAFLASATAFFAAHHIHVERVISDNALNYRRSNDYRHIAAELGIALKFIRPHCPWTNGKVERRLNRTLATEWAYSRVFTSNAERAALLPAWLKHYNLERPHLGIGGLRPIDRVNNPAGQYS
jgi:transposase InsO family protein